MKRTIREVREGDTVFRTNQERYVHAVSGNLVALDCSENGENTGYVYCWRTINALEEFGFKIKGEEDVTEIKAEDAIDAYAKEKGIDPKLVRIKK